MKNKVVQSLPVVALHGVPRSGTSWLGSIINSVPEVLYKFQPLYSYAFRDRLSITTTAVELAVFFEELAHTQSPYLDKTESKGGERLPKFSKSQPAFLAYKEVRYHHLLAHFLAIDKSLKVVGIVRHPLAVLHSWFKAPREFRRDKGWKPIEEWYAAPSANKGQAEQFFGYKRWKETALLFEQLKARYPKRFYLIHYSDLVARPEEEVKALFSFCGLPWQAQSAAFIKASTSLHEDKTYSVYRRKEDDSAWRDGLDPGIVEAVMRDLESDTNGIAKFFR